MTTKDWVIYWKESALRDFETAEILNKSNKYDSCLFFCHLAIEKLLKGLVYKETKETPPFIHDLLKLARMTKISISSDLEKNLQEITTWNIRARYDDVKYQFYKKASSEFTAQWLKKIKEISQWLKNQY